MTDDPRGPFNLANGRFDDVSDAVMMAQDAEIKRLRARVTELLQFNNEFEERARVAERKVRALETTLQLHAGDTKSLSGEIDMWRERALEAEEAVAAANSRAPDR
jgi:hypothetical protein